MNTTFSIELTHYLRTFLNILYPDVCFQCQTPLQYDESYMCKACKPLITSLQSPLCVSCSRELPPFADNGVRCSECKKKTFSFTQNISLIRYNEMAKSVFHEIKHKRRKGIIQIFEPLIQEKFHLLSLPKDDLVMTYVPLDPKRKQVRTFNQSRLLSEIIKKNFGIQLKHNILSRTHSNRPQSLLGRSERLFNLRGIFTVKRPKQVEHKNIVLVDDIFTTGSTVNECTKALLAANAASVHVFTIARAL